MFWSIQLPTGKQCFDRYSSPLRGKRCFGRYSSPIMGKQFFGRYSSPIRSKQCFGRYSSPVRGKQCFDRYSSPLRGKRCFGRYSSPIMGKQFFGRYSSSIRSKQCFGRYSSPIRSKQCFGRYSSPVRGSSLASQECEMYSGMNDTSWMASLMFSSNYIFLKLYFPQIIFSSNYIFLKLYFPQIIFSSTYLNASRPEALPDLNLFTAFRTSSLATALSLNSPNIGIRHRQIHLCLLPGLFNILSVPALNTQPTSSSLHYLPQYYSTHVQRER